MRAVCANDPDGARHIYEALPVRALPDQEPIHMPGVYRPRGNTPSLEMLRRALRSWEQIDRLFERVSGESELHELARPLVKPFLDATGLVLDWGNDHVFFTNETLVAIPERHWDATVAPWMARLSREEREGVCKLHERAREMGF